MEIDTLINTEEIIRKKEKEELMINIWQNKVAEIRPH